MKVLKILSFVLFACSVSFAKTPNISNEVCLIESEKGYKGSGFFVDDNVVMSCYHVMQSYLEKESDNFRVICGNEVAYIQKMLYTDKAKDVAIFSVSEIKNEKLVVFSIGPHKKDDKITAKGHAHGDWDCTTRKGSVKLVALAWTNDEKKPMKNIISDCKVEQGMSGGPVYDSDGCLVGMVHAKSPDGKTSYLVHIDNLIEALSNYTKGRKK